MNYAASAECPAQAYDVVFCLSTIKWIQLHHGAPPLMHSLSTCILTIAINTLLPIRSLIPTGGDAGVKLVFAKVFRTLTEGGLFILEPQPWSSYRKKKGITAGTLMLAYLYSNARH